MNSWKVLVEGLGKIERAEVDIHPLMLFVGDNNSGKSYLVSLLWGLLSLSGELPLSHGDAYRRCVAWMEEHFVRRAQEPEFEVTPEVHADLVQIMNDTLQEQGRALAEKTFNRPGFEVGKIELGNVARRDDLRLRWGVDEYPGQPVDTLMISGLRGQLVDTLMINGLRGGELGWKSEAQTADQRAAKIDYLLERHVLGDLRTGRSRIPGRFHMGPIFLPAGRTGFMLLYRSLAQQIVGDAFAKTDKVHSPLPGLTAPTIDFVKLLMGLGQRTGTFADEAALLERAMGGRLSLRSDVGLNEVLYEHTKGEPPLPMELSSSLVTELAPVVLTLRHVAAYPVLIIEEPEAHLHPHLQRLLARVIVRLVRKGLYVWITTHSENFCQQINDFMKIGAATDRARLRAEMQKTLGYAYDEQDYLTPDDVAGYEFVNQNERSIVRPLQKHPDGLVMPTFNREMVALGREVTFLEQQLAEGV